MPGVVLTVINDNVGSPGLLNRWGWSVHIRARGAEVLFDADTDPEVVRYNSRALGVDLSGLSYAVLSHYHLDHYGGFPAVAAVRPGLPVYAPPGEAGALRRMGLRPVTVYEPVALPGGVYLSGPLYSGEYGVYEQAAAVKTSDGGVVVVVGCSHPGADRLASMLWRLTGLPVRAIIGGFHSPPPAVLDRLIDMADYVCPAHCSGEEAKRYVAKRAPEKYCDVRTGSVLEF